MRARLIYEAFREESDPIADMGIGLYTHRDFSTQEEFFNFLIKHTPNILGTDKIPENILHVQRGNYINEPIFKKLQSYIDEYCTINGTPIVRSIISWPLQFTHMLDDLGYEYKLIK